MYVGGVLVGRAVGVRRWDAEDENKIYVLSKRAKVLRDNTLGFLEFPLEKTFFQRNANARVVFLVSSEKCSTNIRSHSTWSNNFVVENQSRLFLRKK
jgi:hypothetical protein